MDFLTFCHSESLRLYYSVPQVRAGAEIVIGDEVLPVAVLRPAETACPAAFRVPASR
jgi:hypothetical protein